MRTSQISFVLTLAFLFTLCLHETARAQSCTPPPTCSATQASKWNGTGWECVNIGIAYTTCVWREVFPHPHPGWTGWTRTQLLEYPIYCAQGEVMVGISQTDPLAGGVWNPKIFCCK